MSELTDGAAHPLWRSETLTISPRGNVTEIADAVGMPLATCDAEGTVRDASAEVLLRAPLRDQGRRPKPTGVAVDLADDQGQPLGEARVAKYSIGPRRRHVTVSISDQRGAGVGRIEPRDKKGESLTLIAAGAEVATVSVEQVKSGFMRKSRVYTLAMIGALPDAQASLLLGTAIRYDAILEAVAAASVTPD